MLSMCNVAHHTIDCCCEDFLTALCASTRLLNFYFILENKKSLDGDYIPAIIALLHIKGAFTHRRAHRQPCRSAPTMKTITKWVSLPSSQTPTAWLLWVARRTFTGTIDEHAGMARSPRVAASLSRSYQTTSLSSRRPSPAPGLWDA